MGVLVGKFGVMRPQVFSAVRNILHAEETIDADTKKASNEVFYALLGVEVYTHLLTCTLARHAWDVCKTCMGHVCHVQATILELEAEIKRLRGASESQSSTGKRQRNKAVARATATGAGKG